MRRALLAFHGLLLRVLLPPAFRAEYGEELRSAVHARLNSKRGTLSVSCIAALELLDLLRTGVREWLTVGILRSQGLAQGLWMDVWIALRSLAKAPAFSVVAIVTLAAGIGATTAIFSVIDGVLLRSLPYPDAERIVRVAVGTRPESGTTEGPLSPRGYCAKRPPPVARPAALAAAPIAPLTALTQ